MTDIQNHLAEPPHRPLTDYEQGYLDGLEAYSWWKNGIVHVGSCGQTLAGARKVFLREQGLIT